MTSHCPNSFFNTVKEAKNLTFTVLLFLFLSRISSCQFHLKGQKILPSLSLYFIYIQLILFFCTSLYPGATLSLCSCRLCQQRCLQTLIDDGCLWLLLCPAFCLYSKPFYHGFPFFSSQNFLNLFIVI